MTDTQDYNVYDRVAADTIEPGDQILLEGEAIEVRTFDDDGWGVTITGYSLEEGDLVTREIHPDLYVDLWSV